MTVLTTAAVRLLTKYCAASIRSNSPRKFSTENAFGKNFGGTAMTSEPALKEQLTTYRYGNSQNTVRTTDSAIPIFFPILIFFFIFLPPRQLTFFFGFHKLCINTSVKITNTAMKITAMALAYPTWLYLASVL